MLILEIILCNETIDNRLEILPKALLLFVYFTMPLQLFQIEFLVAVPLDAMT